MVVMVMISSGAADHRAPSLGGENKTKFGDGTQAHSAN
jgi:hypothetical protein